EFLEHEKRRFRLSPITIAILLRLVHWLPFLCAFRRAAWRTLDLLQLRIQQFLRSGLFHILFRDHRNSRVYLRFDLLSFGCREGSLNTIIAHAKWILNHERGDRAVFQEAN